MGEIKQALNVLFAVHFPGTGVELEETVPGQKIGGSLVAPQFVGMDHIERQRLLWDVLRRNLTPDQQTHLGTFLTFSPYEVEVMQEMAA